MQLIDSLCLESSASEIQTSDQKYLKELLQACLRQTDYVCSYSLFPTSCLHCTRCDRQPETAGVHWLRANTICSLQGILVPTGVSGTSLPNDGSLKMMPNIHQPMPRKATVSFAQQQATYTTKYRSRSFHGTQMHHHYPQQ